MWKNNKEVDDKSDTFDFLRMLKLPGRMQRLGLRIKFTLLLFSLSLGAMALIGGYGYQNARAALSAKATQLAEGYVSQLSIRIKSALDLAKNDLQFIGGNYSVLRLFYWKDIGVEEKQQQYQDIVSDTLRGFIETYEYTFKIRIADASGREVIHVNHDPVTEKTEILRDLDLENLHDQNFFTETLGQAPGGIYVSPILISDRKSANGLAMPIIRLGMPVVSSNHVKYGAVISTVFAESFLSFIRAANQNKDGRTFYLIDESGQYLFHPEIERTFGQVQHGESIERDFPDLSAQMLTREHGTTVVDGKIVAFETIYPVAGNKDRRWLLFGVVSEAVALAELREFEQVFVTMFVLLVFIVFLANRYFLGNLMRPLGFVTTQLQRLGRGEIQVETLAYQARDEIHDMIASTHALMLGMERFAQQADAVGQGDFSGQAELLSAHDRLGNALNNMIVLLRNAKNDSDKRDWLRDGFAVLSRTLTGDLSSQQLAEESISMVSRYLGAGRGVFYKYDAGREILDLLGSYMYTERPQAGSCFKLGEGAIGQVAREKKAIVLTHVTDQDAPIVTGTQYASASFIYTWPLLHENELLGVLELACFERFDANKREFLEGACEVIGSFLYVVEQRERIKKLLAIAEASEKEAKEKSRRLQEMNAQMEEQQQQLQQQTEELQQTNAQMEEQQQQLQQQTEELQQTNAQMEEQQIQLEQRNRDLLLSQQELDNKAKLLEQSGRYKSEFLANMSHELRTPLNSIILLSKMMSENEDAKLDMEAVKRAEIIHRSGQDLLRLINDVLDLSKVEAGRMALNAKPITSSTLIEEFREQFEPIAKAHGLTFACEDQFQGQFVSDPDKVSQILRNLLSNAFKFTKKGGVTLCIERCLQSECPICIGVSDTGIGIPQDKQQLVFEAFQQADGSTSREFGGTGLGLTISRRLAKLLGGDIELDSQPGQGSRFVLKLPDILEPTGAGVPAIPALPPTVSTDKKPAHESSAEDDRDNLGPEDYVILLIDDDMGFANEVAAIIHKLGYKALLAASGNDGLELTQRYHPNGILLDLGLPDMDGTQVLHRLKTNPELASIPVYVVSARDRDDALMRQGSIGYLQKPADDNQIAGVVNEMLSAISSEDSILVVESGSISAADVTRIVGNRAGHVGRATDGDSLEAALNKHSWRLAIIDLDDRSTDQGLAVAQKIRAKSPATDLLFFSEKAIGDADDTRLRHFTDSIIIKTPMADQRLSENIQRFLKEVKKIKPDGHTDAPYGIKRLIDKHILVVDDDPRNLFVITAALEQNGAKVGNAINGRHAMDYLSHHTVDLVVMDIMMPEMDGYQSISQLRADPKLSKIPVLALTAKALPNDREKALAAGADDYLSKPVNYGQLIDLAVTLCASPHQTR